MELHVHSILVYIVVVQLMEDVEVGIVTLVGLVGVQRTCSVECKTEWVDVEATAHCTAHQVNVLVQCARGFLIDVAGIGAQCKGQPFRDVERCIHVSCETLHVAGFRPAWVYHGRDRGIEVGFLCSTRNAH